MSATSFDLLRVAKAPEDKLLWGFGLLKEAKSRSQSQKAKKKRGQNEHLQAIKAIMNKAKKSGLTFKEFMIAVESGSYNSAEDGYLESYAEDEDGYCIFHVYGFDDPYKATARKTAESWYSKPMKTDGT